MNKWSYLQARLPLEIQNILSETLYQLSENHQIPNWKLLEQKQATLAVPIEAVLIANNHALIHDLVDFKGDYSPSANGYLSTAMLAAINALLSQIPLVLPGIMNATPISEAFTAALVLALQESLNEDWPENLAILEGFIETTETDMTVQLEEWALTGASVVRSVDVPASNEYSLLIYDQYYSKKIYQVKVLDSSDQDLYASYSFTLISETTQLNINETIENRPVVYDQNLDKIGKILDPATIASFNMEQAIVLASCAQMELPEVLRIINATFISDQFGNADYAKLMYAYLNFGRIDSMTEFSQMNTKMFGEAVQRSIDKKLVKFDPSVDIDALIASLFQDVKDYVFDDANNQLHADLGKIFSVMGFSDAQKQTFLNAVSAKRYSTDAFIQHLKDKALFDAATIDKIDAMHFAMAVSYNSADIIEALDNSGDLVSRYALTSKGFSEWETVLSTVFPNADAAHIAKRAGEIMNNVEQRERAAFFFGQLPANPRAELSAVRDLWNTYQFDLGVNDLEDTLFTPNAGDTDLQNQKDFINQLNRLVKLTPDLRRDLILPELVNLNIGNSLEVLQVGEKQIASTLAAISGGFLDADKVAAETVLRAQTVIDANLMSQMITDDSQQLIELLSNAPLSGTSSAMSSGSGTLAAPTDDTRPTENGSTVIADNTDYCECRDCSSILSPSAYLVDLLKYLEDADSNSKVIPSGNDLFALLNARRPDIQLLKLNCKNSHTPLPYIDLVNEQLENVVKSDGIERQTTLEADKLRETPEHTNIPALRIVAGKDATPLGMTYATAPFVPIGLPFNYWNSASDIYLKEMGADLNSFRFYTDTGLSNEQSLHLDTEDVALLRLSKNDYYRLYRSGSSTAMTDLVNISNIMEDLEIDYEQFKSLVALNYVNPSAHEIVFPAGSCQIDEATFLAGGSFTDDERKYAWSWMHKLLRLAGRNGWTVAQADHLSHAAKIVETPISSAWYTDTHLTTISRAAKFITTHKIDSQHLWSYFYDYNASLPYMDAYKAHWMQVCEDHHLVFNGNQSFADYIAAAFDGNLTTTGVLAKLPMNDSHIIRFLAALSGMKYDFVAEIVERFYTGASLDKAEIQPLWGAFSDLLLWKSKKADVMAARIYAALHRHQAISWPAHTANPDVIASSLVDMGLLVQQLAQLGESELQALSDCLLGVNREEASNKEGFYHENALLPLMQALAEATNGLYHFKNSDVSTPSDYLVFAEQSLDAYNGKFIITQLMYLGNPEDTARALAAQLVEMRDHIAASFDGEVGYHSYYQNNLTTLKNDMVSGLNITGITTWFNGVFPNPGTNESYIPSAGELTTMAELVGDFTLFLEGKVGVTAMKNQRKEAVETTLATYFEIDADLASTLTNNVKTYDVNGSGPIKPIMDMIGAFALYPADVSTADAELLRFYRDVRLLTQTSTAFDMQGHENYLLKDLGAGKKGYGYGTMRFENDITSVSVDATWELFDDITALYGNPYTLVLSHTAVSEYLTDVTDADLRVELLVKHFGITAADASLLVAAPEIQPTDAATLAGFLLRLCGKIDFLQKTQMSMALFNELAALTTDMDLQQAINEHGAALWTSSRDTLIAANDAIRDAKRDGLLQFIASYDPNNAFDTKKSVFDYLLMDIEMEPCMMTSRLVEATLAVQQFVNRIQFGLEEASPGTTLRFDKSFEADWRTLGRYRVWEANRKVLAHPENYLEPELRDNKTHLFQTMTDKITEGNFTDQVIQQAYLEYLYELEDMSHLEIAHFFNEYRGAEAHQDIVHLIARTREEPKKYYSRTFKDNAWDEFVKIDVPIENDYSFPVYYAGRLFLFWLNIEENMKADKKGNANDEQQSVGSETDDGKSPERKVTYKIWVSWTSYDAIEKKWGKPHRSKDFVESFESVRKGPLLDQFFVTTQIDSNERLHFRIFEHVVVETEGNDGTQRQKLIYELADRLVMDHPRANVVKYIEHRSRAQALYVRGGTLTPRFGNPPENYVEFHDYMYNRENFKDNAELPSLGYNKYRFGNLDKVVLNYSGMYEDADPQPSNFVEHEDYTEYESNQNDARKTLLHYANNLPFALTLISATQAESYGKDPVNKFLDRLFYENAKHVFFINYLGTERENLTLTYTTRETTVREGQVKCFYKPDGMTPIEFESPSPTPVTVQVSPGSQLFYSNTRPVFNQMQTRDFEIGEDGGCRIYDSTQEESHEWNYGIERTRKYQAHPFYHPYLSLLIAQINKYGYEGALKPLNVGDGSDPETLYRQGKENTYFSNYYDETDEEGMIMEPYPQDDFNFDFSSGYGLYNWELFFFTPLFVANEMNKSGHYEKADQWFRYIFDPANDISEKPKDYWNFKPFYEIFDGNGLANGGLQKLIEGLNLGYGEAVSQFFAWKNNPFNPHAIARLRQGAYMKMFVQKYLENLLDWADSLFREFSQESINEASQIYRTVKGFLGDKPTATESAEVGDKNFSEHKTCVSGYSPNIDEWEDENGVQYPGGGADYSGTMASQYWSLLCFCLPNNADMLDLWDRVDDRLYKIRHCLNIDGVKVALPLFAPPIDPAALVAALAGGLSLASALNALNVGAPLYRFQWLHQKAVQYANEAKGLGNALLSALEKKDAEELAQLQQKQAINVNKSILKIREQSIEEANLALQAHDLLIANAQFRQSHYTGLLEEGLITGEKTQLTMQSLSLAYYLSSGVISGIATALEAVPDIQTGYASLGGFLTAGYGGDKLGNVAQGGVKMLETFIGAAGQVGAIAGLNASWARRKQEWQFQKDVAGRDITQLEKQKEALTLRIQMAEQELENQNQQIANSEQTLEFYQSKFTNKDLYHYISGELRSLHGKAMKQAHQLANMAQTAFNYELPYQAETFVDTAYLKGGKENLMAADHLLNDLREMEVSHISGNKREMEITKHFSLALFNPKALMDLKENGFCAFETPEWAYDMDYPGMYMRRIKAVRLTIPCVTGPNIQVNAKLTLTGNKMRVKAEPGVNYMDDDRFVFNRARVQTIAAAEAQQDDGLFQFDFNDARYLPFEGAGAHASWTLELPDGLRQFDYSSISDVILHIDYMALNAGGLLAEAAKTNVLTQFKGGDGYVLFSVRNLYGDAFEALLDTSQVIPLDDRILPPMLQGKNVSFNDGDFFKAIDGQLSVQNGAAYGANDHEIALPGYTASTRPDDIFVVLTISDIS